MCRQCASWPTTCKAVLKELGLRCQRLNIQMESSQGSWTVQHAFQDGYLWDWLAAAAAILINHLVPVMTIDVRHRFYTLGDPSLSYPSQSNTVSSTVLYILTFVWPGVIFVVSACLQRSFADGHHALLSLAEGFALACGFKRWMNLVGRLRPNWLAVLGTDKEEDSRQAYPSGHSAYMFFSATILTCYLLGKLRILATPSKGLFAKLIVALAPVYLATFVACTRLADYKHDFSDVNAGCFIGVCSGLLAYFLNYPSLLDERCHLPKLRSRLSPLSASPASSQQPRPPGQLDEHKGDVAAQAAGANNTHTV